MESVKNDKIGVYDLIRIIEVALRVPVYGLDKNDSMVTSVNELIINALDELNVRIVGEEKIESSCTCGYNLIPASNSGVTITNGAMSGDITYSYGTSQSSF